MYNRRLTAGNFQTFNFEYFRNVRARVLVNSASHPRYHQSLPYLKLCVRLWQSNKALWELWQMCLYLRGNLSENDQQQGLHNGSAPFCNRPGFLRLPRTQGCHQHLWGENISHFLSQMYHFIIFWLQQGLFSYTCSSALHPISIGGWEEFWTCITSMLTSLLVSFRCIVNPTFMLLLNEYPHHKK